MAVDDAIGPYRLVEPLGSGGFAAVFIGVHQQLGRRVALKVLHPESCRSLEPVLRFVDEGKLLNRVSHPNVVDAADIIISPDQPPCLVMELLEGETLAERLSRAPALSVDDLLDIASQICAGLAAVHAEGMLHRDLKPENIVLLATERGVRVKLIDFGIAKSMSTAGGFQTATDQVLGTIDYLAPEQFSGAPTNARVDIYALGVILYEMLADCTPFDMETTLNRATGSHRGDPEPPSAHRRQAGDKLPQGLDEVVLYCLMADPANRAGSADEVLDLIQAIRQGTKTAPLPARRRPRRRASGRRTSILLALALAIASAFVGWRMLGEAASLATALPAGSTATSSALGALPCARVVLLRSTPPATVTHLDTGRTIGRTPIALVVGKRQSQRVRLSASGFGSTEVALTDDSANRVTVRLHRSRARVASPPGRRSSSPAPTTVVRPRPIGPRRRPPKFSHGLNVVDPFRAK